VAARNEPVFDAIDEAVDTARGILKPGASRIVDLGDGLTFEFVWCPPGTFMMGSPADEPGRKPHETQHKVTLTKGFWMGKYEVTRAQWKKFSIPGGSGSANVANNPIEAVTRDDCILYTTKLNERAQGLKSPKIGKFRLPTEAEWEYACRAGSTTGVLPPAELDKVAWYAANSGGQMRTVGQKSPNAWGLHDMLGNVAEWCSDNYEPFSEKAISDPKGPANSDLGVYRGGSVQGGSTFIRPAARFPCSPATRSHNVGFRLVME
jgi:formylglycine-generating enzyme required for sulfatase activity